MKIITINSFLKIILILVFLFSASSSFSVQINGRRCAEGFGFSKELTLKKAFTLEPSIESRFGYSFKDQKLKLRALTRRSHYILKTYYKHNTLEFLGDTVFGLFLAETLLRRYPLANKRKLYEMWSLLVSNKNFAEQALILKLDKYILDRDIRIRAHHARSNRRRAPLVLADFLEALVGAVYMDGGYMEAKKLVLKLFDLSQASRSDMRLLSEEDSSYTTPLRIRFPGLRGIKFLSSSLYNLHYERLMFLGHAVFNLHITSALLNKGVYSTKALVKKKRFLHNFIELSNLPEKLQLSMIEVLNKKPLKERSLYDSFYFLLGAVYLEKGYKETEVLVTTLVEKSSALEEFENVSNTQKKAEFNKRVRVPLRL